MLQGHVGKNYFPKSSFRIGLLGKPENNKELELERSSLFLDYVFLVIRNWGRSQIIFSHRIYCTSTKREEKIKLGYIQYLTLSVFRLTDFRVCILFLATH